MPKPVMCCFIKPFTLKFLLTPESLTKITALGDTFYDHFNFVFILLIHLN